jgi:hypothetical protein
MVKTHTPQIIGDAASRRKRSDAENRRGNRKIQQDGFSSQNMLPRICPSRQQQQPQHSQVAVSGPNTGELLKASPPQTAKQAAPIPLLVNAHQRKGGGLQSPGRASGQTDIMTKVSQSRFHLMACNLWTTCSKLFPKYSRSSQNSVDLFRRRKNSCHYKKLY